MPTSSACDTCFLCNEVTICRSRSFANTLRRSIAARRLGEYGIDGRHLRAFKISADREVGLVEQAIAPHVRRAGGNKDVSGEVTQLVISFHAALLRTAMER